MDLVRAHETGRARRWTVIYMTLSSSRLGKKWPCQSLLSPLFHLQIAQFTIPALDYSVARRMEEYKIFGGINIEWQTRTVSTAGAVGAAS